MTHWSEQAQQDSGPGMSDSKAGDPVHPCVENAVLEPLVDFNELTVLDPAISVEAQPAVEHELKVADPPPVLAHELHVFSGSGES